MDVVVEPICLPNLRALFVCGKVPTQWLQSLSAPSLETLDYRVANSYGLIVPTALGSRTLISSIELKWLKPRNPYYVLDNDWREELRSFLLLHSTLEIIIIIHCSETSPKC